MLAVTSHAYHVNSIDGIMVPTVKRWSYGPRPNLYIQGLRLLTNLFWYILSISCDFREEIRNLD